MACSKRSSERAVSVSSMRTTKAPPAWRANRKLYSAVRAEPMCSVPVGLGAKRTLTVWSRLMVTALSVAAGPPSAESTTPATPGRPGDRLQGAVQRTRAEQWKAACRHPLRRPPPYIDAVLGYRTQGMAAFHTPGHKLGKGAPPIMRELFG